MSSFSAREIFALDWCQLPVLVCCVCSLADFTADSAFPFALMLYEELVLCLIPHCWMKSSKSVEENGGPLSLTMTSRMPYLPKMVFQFVDDRYGSCFV